MIQKSAIAGFCGAIGLHTGLVAAAFLWSQGGPGNDGPKEEPISVFFSSSEPADAPAGNPLAPEAPSADVPAPLPAPLAAIAEQAPPALPSGPIEAAPPQRKSAGRRAGHAGGSSHGGLSGGGASGVAYLFAPPPAYPPEALRRRIEGIVLLAVLIDPEGRPEMVSIEHSSGSALLDEKAARAVRGWRFQPARTGRSCRVKVPIQFRIAK